MTDTYVALLRGINVGGKNKLPMRDLAVLCTEAGGVGVQTYIQSGNVIFQTDPEAAEELPAKLTALIAERFGYRVPVVLRSASQLKAIIAGNPLLGQEASEEVSEEACHVLFLADLPSADRIAALDPGRSAPDMFAVRGREIYLHLPNGAKDTKLTNAYFDTKLATVSTSRNWRTATALLGLMSR